MGPLLLLLLLPAFIGFIVYVVQRGLEQLARLSEDWKRQMEALGLNVRVQGKHQFTAQGALEGVRVMAELKYDQAREPKGLRSTLSVRGDGIPSNLEVLNGSFLRSMAALIEARDEVPLGDPDFDQKVKRSVLDAYGCAALSHEARQRLLTLVDGDGWVQHGQVTCQRNWMSDDEGKAPQLQPLLHASAELARLLRVPAQALAQRLAHNALQDPEPAVRLKNLRFLLAAETQAPPELLASTARALLGDVFPVRLLAAQQLGAEGHGVLRALAADGDAWLEQRLAAVQSLGLGPTPDLEGLRALLDGKHPPELRSAALAAVPATGAALVESVVSCTRSKHEAVRVAAARALGVLAQPHTEATLLQLLSDDSADVQHASIEALGALGSVAAVEPLLPLAESLLRPQLRQTARSSIGRIQSRLGNAEAGRVSLAEHRELEGALTLAARSAGVRVGELSLAGEAGPRLPQQEMSAQAEESEGLASASRRATLE